MCDPRLFTTHGQVLVFDAENSCVRASEDLNDEHVLRLCRVGSQGYLYYFHGEDKKNVSIDHFSVVTSHDIPNAGSFFDIRSPERNFIYLGQNGFFLSAEPNGSINFKVWMEIYEKFWLCYDESCENLLLNNDWISSSLNRLIKKVDIRLRADFKMSIGEIEYRLSDISEHGHVQDGRRVHLLYDRFKIECLDLFRPLIYFSAYGGENSFKLLSMCMSSFEKYGKYSGDYMIITDKNRDYIENYVGFIDNSRLRIEFVPVIDVVDMVCARFKIFDIPNIAKYQPILYSDFDIICNSGLQDMLLQLDARSNIFVKAEGELKLKHYGSVLIENDEHSKMNNVLGFNSGVIGFRHITDVELNFK